MPVGGGVRGKVTELAAKRHSSHRAWEITCNSGVPLSSPPSPMQKPVPGLMRRKGECPAGVRVVKAAQRFQPAP